MVNALTAVWMLSNITVEIMVAYNPLNLDSIFTVTKISANVFQLWKSLLPHPLFTVETADTWCIVLTIINSKQRWLPMNVFPWQLLFGSMPYMQTNIFLRKGFWSKSHVLTNFSTISHTEFRIFDHIIDAVIRNTCYAMNYNDMTLTKKLHMQFRIWAHKNVTKLKKWIFIRILKSNMFFGTPCICISKTKKHTTNH